MTDLFDFIADDEFRGSLKSDFEEVERAFQSGSWKTVLVLCGSIVEAIMVDYFLHSRAEPFPKSQVISMTFSNLIDVIHAEKAIGNGTRDLATVIKDYRNLIHAGRQIRLNQKPSRESANIAQSLVRMIAEEVGYNARKNQGFTAEQLVSKLERDPTASNIVKHYAQKMSKDQLIKFMVTNAPNHFFELDSRIEVCQFESDITELLRIQRALCSSYHSIFHLLGEAGKAVVASHLVQVVNEGSESYIRSYLENFFRPEFLPLLDTSEREHVEDYVLSCLRTNTTEKLLDSIERLHRNLSLSKHNVFIRMVVNRYLRSDTREIKNKLRSIIMMCI